MKSLTEDGDELDMESPLAEGRELKYPWRNCIPSHLSSPLAEGRELKCDGVKLLRSTLTGSPLAEGRELKSQKR